MPNESQTFGAEIVNFLTSPPPGVVSWLTLIIAIIPTLWLIIAHRLESKQRGRDRRRAISEEYLYRNYVNPLFLKPLTDLLINTSEKLRRITKKSNDESPEKSQITILYNDFLDDFKVKKEGLMNRLLLIEQIEKNLYESAATHLDDLDDAITEHCAFHSSGIAISDKQYEKYSVTDRKIYATGALIFSLVIDSRTGMDGRS